MTPTATEVTDRDVEAYLDAFDPERWDEYTEDEREKSVVWFCSRPPAIRRRVLEYPPGRLFTLRTTGQRMEIHSYRSNDKCTVAWVEDPWIDTELNLMHLVQDIDYGDLEPCGWEATPIGPYLIRDKPPRDHHWGQPPEAENAP